MTRTDVVFVLFTNNLLSTAFAIDDDSGEPLNGEQKYTDHLPRKNYESAKTVTMSKGNQDWSVAGMQYAPAPDIGEEEKSIMPISQNDAESDKDKDYGIDEWIAHTLSPCPYRNNRDGSA